MLTRIGPSRFALTVALGALAAALGTLIIAVSAMPATAAGFVHSISQKVALIPQNGPVPPNGPDGIMPISSFVSGRQTESFDQFSFTNVALSQITTANLARYDTVALIQVKSSSLTATAQSALANFVAGGGKLLIHDSDETTRNDYSWLLPGGSSTTQVGTGCNGCGSNSATSTITNSSLISANPADPSYVNFPDLAKFTDVGDSNLLVSTDPRWFALAKGTNARNESGAQVAFADNNGLIVYNGFDTDFIKTKASDPWRCTDPMLGYKCPPPPAAQPTVDWLAQMWYSELVQGWGTTGQPGGGSLRGGLPHKNPVVELGTRLAASLAGLPSNRRCVARRTLVLRLQRLSHLRHRKIVQVDVYVNRRHVLRERGHFTNETLRHLPRHGRFTVKVVATTSRGYHLIAMQRYRAC